MSTPLACQTCGAVLAPNSSPAGLCPACLFAQALGATTNLEPPVEVQRSDLAPGQDFGRFRIEGILGKGGMSTVYRAHEKGPMLDRVVALKVLPAEFLHDESFAQRFHQEARVVAALEHSHIVPLYASGIENGIPWMSMRLLPGGSLADLLAGGSLEARRAVDILRGVAAALDYAHTHGIWHRDVKPSNILLDRAGHVFVGDFGIAHLMEGSVVRTRTGVVPGTPHYMAPEHVRSQSTDHRMDIYSLGVVAWETLTGRPPYDADSPLAIAMKHVSEPLPTPPGQGMSDATVRALHKAMAKAPWKRWATATEFVDALSQGIVVPSPVPLALPRKTLWVGGLALAAGIGVFVALMPDSVLQEPVEGTAPAAVPAEESGPPTNVQPEPPNPLPIRPAGDRSMVAGTEQKLVSNVPRAVVVIPSPPQIVPEVEPDRTPPDESRPVRDDVQPLLPVAQEPATVPEVSATADSARPVQPQPADSTVTQPVRIAEVNPEYPPLARAGDVQGDVVLQAIVGPDGRVVSVTVVRSAHRLLDEAARQAVLQYRYRPGVRNGVPDTFSVMETVSFVIK